MRKLVLLLMVAAACLCVRALDLPTRKHLGWNPLDISADPALVRVHTFEIYLTQNNLHTLESKVWEVSDPLSPKYGQYLSVGEVTQIVSPPTHALEEVTQWVEAHGGKIVLSANKDVMRVQMSKKMIEKMLNVRMHVFEHTSGRRLLRSSTEYEVPSHIQPYVDMIRRISDFPVISNKKKTNLKQKAADAPAGTPVPVRARGRATTITIAYTPTCANATSATTNTIPPCQDYPPLLSGVSVSAEGWYDTTPSQYIGGGAPQCFLDPDNNNTVLCQATVQVPSYYLFNLTLTSEFSDNSKFSASFPYPVMASPEVLPQTIREYYKIPQNYKVTHPNATQCVVEFEQQYYTDPDLRLFFDQMGLPRDTTVTVIGPNDETNPGIEANLDIQYIMGVGVGAPTTFWSIYANSTEEIDDILAWAVAMSNTQNPPLVNSLSYGMAEVNVDTYLGKGYLARSDVEFQKLAVRGISIIIADGDSGASDLGPPPMSQPDCKPLIGDWPSQSPFVTAVSATIMTPMAEMICYQQSEDGGIDCHTQPLGEVPTSVELGLPWTTGGGVSNTSSVPAYQEAVVVRYLKSLAELSLLPPQDYFNAKGRMYPDVAMVGHNLLVAQQGTFITVDGTSASAPVFAGLVTLLNDVRMRAGKPALGFLNPLLYQIAKDYPEAFNDITYGHNACGDIEFEPVCCPYGWHALPGYDAVSGLGSPNFDVLKDIVLRY